MNQIKQLIYTLLEVKNGYTNFSDNLMIKKRGKGSREQLPFF